MTAEEWSQQPVHRGILKVALTVGTLTVAVKLAAVLKEAIVARQFGTGDALDAYLIALVLPQFAINLVGGSLNAALIPTYVQVKARAGPVSAQRLFAGVTALSLTILLVLALILAVSAPALLPLVAPGFPAAKLALVESLFLLLLPTLVLSGVTTTWSAILNANDRFALAACVPAATSALVIVLVGLKGAAWRIEALVAATVGGAILEAGLLGWGLTRQGISLTPRWHGLTDDVKRVVGQYTPVLAGAVLMGGTALVSQSMATVLGPGRVSVLAYGSKLTTLVLGIVAVAVSTAVLPAFSHMVAAEDWAGLRRSLRTYTRLLLIATVPPTILLMVISKPLVVLLFQRGAFTADDSGIVAWTQAVYLLQIPAVVVGTLLVRLIAALGANRFLMWGSLLNLAMNIGLAYVLMQRLDVVGIALATSLMYLGSVSFLWVSAARLLRGMPRAAQPDRQPQEVRP